MTPPPDPTDAPAGTPPEAAEPAIGATRDRLVSALSGDGHVGVRALDATDLVAWATRIRPMSPTAAVALARGLMGALLLVAGKKDGETIQIQARGSGPLGSILAMADAEGRARGTVSHPLAEAHGITQFVNVPAALGRGTLSVIRTRPGWREPYRGIVPLETGELARDLTRYLHDSEQVRSALALSASIGEGGRLEAAAAYLIEALPGAPDDVLVRFEERVAVLPRAAEIVKQAGAHGLLETLCEGETMSAQAETTPVFHCPCTRERARRSLLLLGANELHSMALADVRQEIGCEFCGRTYEVGREELAVLAGEAAEL